MNGVVRSAPLRGASDRSTRSRPPCSADATASVDVPSKQCVHSAATRRRAAPAPPARARQARRSRQLFVPRCEKRSLAAWSAHRSPPAAAPAASVCPSRASAFVRSLATTFGGRRRDTTTTLPDRFLHCNRHAKIASNRGRRGGKPFHGGWGPCCPLAPIGANIYVRNTSR